MTDREPRTRTQAAPVQPGQKLAKAYYGSAQEKFQVLPGDVWGDQDNRLLCGDMFKLAETGLLERHIPPADIIYTDPPWTPGIYSRFYYYADKTTDFYFLQFIDETAELLKRTSKGLVFICFGMSYKDHLISSLEHAGASTLRIVNAVYTKRQTPYIVWCGSFDQTVTLPEFPTSFRTENEELSVIYTQCVKKNMTVFDPMCGVMNFLIPARQRGAKVFGAELIPRKFAEGLKGISGSVNVGRLEQNEL